MTLAKVVPDREYSAKDSRNTGEKGHKVKRASGVVARQPHDTSFSTRNDAASVWGVDQLPPALEESRHIRHAHSVSGELLAAVIG